MIQKNECDIKLHDYWCNIDNYLYIMSLMGYKTEVNSTWDHFLSLSPGDYVILAMKDIIEAEECLSNKQDCLNCL